MDLQQLASVGGFFALRSGTSPTAVPLAEVYAGDGARLAARVDTVTARLAAPEVRIGVSVAQLGLAARLCSVALGGAALYGRVLDLDPRRLSWDPDGSSPDDLWLDAVRTLPVEALGDSLVEGHLAPLAAALRRRYRIAEPLLWGNAGSALAGAVRALHTWAGSAGRPEVAERALDLGADLFCRPELRGTGTLGALPRFRRRSCCLYYRCPGGGVCGDCCFDRAPGRG
ncbi:IucA/IucC family C-terminal-domain containing protein [Streptomyces boluensis]|uniref:Ferric iron reductase n=1 Tax=Streptomyces boluensis TaxID=1775135 RepID=A0A964UPQ2_9ACTN|nr:IucA/IucC family C-terminal-domain containing protein [Streptomyces boluensis]NBE52100.1 ferric iron reductase [Streptomyces boluensis]